jgi:phosphatidylglycerophosphate synthase
MPSIAEVKSVTQPEGLLTRPGAEHWAGRLFMRRLSPYFTSLLLRTPLSPNAVTALMIPAGLGAALAVSFPGLGPAIAAVALAQLQLLLDCSDGEVARWRRSYSPKGIYLDQLAHYSTEASLAAALGVRADGGWGSLGGWTALGLSVAVLILLLKSETHLAQIARLKSGSAEAEEPEATSPRGGARRIPLRQGARLLPVFRPFQAVEATLLALGAAVVDAFDGDLLGSRVLVAALVVAGLVAVSGHLVAILGSARLAPGPAERND